MAALTPTSAAIAGERVGTNKLTGKLLYGFDHCLQSTNDWLSPLERLPIRIFEPRAIWTRGLRMSANFPFPQPRIFAHSEPRCGQAHALADLRGLGMKHREMSSASDRRV